MLVLAMKAGGALSFPEITASALSDTVEVVDPSDVLPDVNLKNHEDEIPADDAYHTIDDIWVSEYDPVYTYELTQLQVFSNGFVSLGTCGSHDYQLGTGSDLEAAIGYAFNGINNDTGRTLQLSIQASGTEPDCQISGGIVKAWFQITGP